MCLLIISMRLSFLIPARAAIPPYERGVLYSHLLSHQQLERGIGYLGSLSRLKRIMSWKLKEKGSGLHVTTVGG